MVDELDSPETHIDAPRDGDTVRIGIDDIGSAATALVVAGSPADGVAVTRPHSHPLGSRYAIGEKMLGSGGMGEVIVAFDEQIGREVAIKRMRSAQPSQEELSRFVREARVQGRLEHPAVVPVHDLAYDGSGKPYFVMKRLTGTDMQHALTSLRAGDEPDEAGCRRRLLRAFSDVCLAVEFAHSRGIIHRDLKPANIMLGDFGEVYVLDWGVARAITRVDDDARELIHEDARDLELESGETQVGAVLGTRTYMAPEQLVGDRVGPAADIYALGCVLFEIAADKPLHARDRSIKHVFHPVDRKPSNCRADSPPELDAICERALEFDPGARFRSARAMGNAVQAYLDGDRDVVVRRELAAHHIAEAREALTRGTLESHRRAAMQAAARALALDPTAIDAADLITRLMLEPPAAIPEAVLGRVASLESEAERVQGRFAAVAVLGYLGFLPLIAWAGIRDISLIVAFVVFAVLSSVHSIVLTHRTRVTAAPVYLSVALNAVVIGIVCRMVGPFIIGPTLVIVTLLAFASHPGFGRVSVVATILSASVLVPWILELVGVLEPTYRFTEAGIVVMSGALKLSSLPTQLAFGTVLIALVVIVAVWVRGLATRHRELMSRLELQAWHLRQIVPTIA